MSKHTPTPPKVYELAACNWQGNLHCVYLNDYRIAGGKPWGGGTTAKRWNVTVDDIAAAIPEIRQQLDLHDDLMKFAATIARMKQDGEEVEGKEFVMENDDAVMTLNELISEARALTKAKEAA